MTNQLYGYRSILLAILLAVGSVWALLPSVTAKNSVCEGAALSGAQLNCSDDKTKPSDDKFAKLVKTVINVLSIVVGAVSVVMIIVGGFRYVISGGDSAGIKGAKDTIMYALIGLVVVLFAQAIVRFVFAGAGS